ncbi:2-dehydropantoate 2-reductase [Stipitochalara longipes BDJ]|nr:2-dehydropantoate 2-reductase [Stipitochalara longipes BDJ]
MARRRVGGGRLRSQGKGKGKGKGRGNEMKDEIRCRRCFPHRGPQHLRRLPALPSSRYLIHSQAPYHLYGTKSYFQRHWKSQTSPAMNTSSGHIHVLGLGNLGRLFAHELAIQPSPPLITLLLHRQSLFGEWETVGKKIEITTDGVVSTSSNYDIELVSQGQHGVIENLIVATKALNTTKALLSIKHRLTSNSTVLFTQNGMGTVEEVTRSVFPNLSTRPHYLKSITSHGVYSLGPFRSVHAGLAYVTIGPAILPGQPDPRDSSKSQYLIDRIVHSPGLAAKEVDPQELVRLQLEKLVVNAMINPLTVIFDCQNGELFNRGSIVHLMRLLLAEASQVIQLLPELREDPETASRFSTQKLEMIVLDVAEKTAKNTSSMLQDVRAGRPTEIDYINGYIVKRGKEQGVDCEMNDKVIRLVKEGKVIGANDTKSEFEPESWLGAVFSIFI